MLIKILGTAAAEGWPAVFCRCETCQRVRKAGGKDIRSRASIQFTRLRQGDFAKATSPRGYGGQASHQIDLPPDHWYHEAVLGADMSGLEHLFITHSHQDHWSPRSLLFLAPPFGHGRTEPLNVYGNEVVVQQGTDMYKNREGDTVVFHQIEPFVPVQAGDFVFTPLRARHMQNEECLNYLVTSDGKTVLYNCDTGWYTDDTWEFLEDQRLDAIISECTCGPHSGGSGHMSFETVFALKERLEKAGAFNNGVFVATHFSHNVGLLHSELEYILNERHIQTAYDGMEISL